MMRDLVRCADVLIENWTPGVLAKYGVSYEAMSPFNPRLIMCSLSGYGQNGPNSHLPGNDLIAFAASGILNMVGYPDDSPLYPGGGSLADRCRPMSWASRRAAQTCRNRWMARSGGSGPYRSTSSCRLRPGKYSMT